MMWKILQTNVKIHRGTEWGYLFITLDQQTQVRPFPPINNHLVYYVDFCFIIS